MKVTLATTGRRSGTAREVPLYAWPDGNRLIVVGSQGGAASDPAWANNLRAEPMATVRVGRELRSVRAIEVAEEERGRLWQLVCAEFPLDATYQRRTRRDDPALRARARGEVSSGRGERFDAVPGAVALSLTA